VSVVACWRVSGAEIPLAAARAAAKAHSLGATSGSVGGGA
jgi:hypothetical protein